MDALSALEEEVSLEGLDGITLPSLWIRLGDRRPQFPLKLDDLTKGFLWRALVHNTELTFYEQPQEREDVELFDRFKGIDPDTGFEVKGLSLDNRKDVYPVQIVPESQGVQGSCVFFTQRRDITERIRSEANTPLLSLEEAWERFGRRLMVVASQKMRFRALIGRESDPDLKLTDESYCVLERVGRSRWQGELQRDLHNASFKIDPRKIHYLRKSLVKYGLITMQSHVSRLSSGQQQHSVLLTLNRFHISRRGKYDFLMEQVSNALLMTPGRLCTLMVLREHLKVDERVFKRVVQCMRSSKVVELLRVPLDELDPESGPCVNKRGNKVQVNCLKLLKPYSKKGEEEDDEDEEGGDLRPEGRFMERDVLSQAYDMVVTSGTKGMTCTGIGLRMNVGKLERRMICRQLEREGVVKGFMEDMGRQRTTKYLSHKCVDVSDKLHQFAKEHERNKLLCSSVDSPSAEPKALSNLAMCRKPTPCKTKQRPRRPGSNKKPANQAEVPQTPKDQPDTPETEPEAAVEGAVSVSSSLTQTQSEEVPQVVVRDVEPKLARGRHHETYRLLKRKNLIVEAIQDFKIIEGLFPLQKIINEEEKRLGFSTRCCKKTILRLLHSLAREGLVKLFSTTVIQDGITKKVEMFAHPSVQPSDDTVQTIIEQVRFKISSSYTTKHNPDDSKSTEGSSDGKVGGSKSHRRGAGKKAIKKEEFKPTTVRGLSKTFGYQPKMHRLRVLHNFLFYMIYEHPMRHEPKTPEKAPADQDNPAPNTHEATPTTPGAPPTTPKATPTTPKATPTTSRATPTTSGVPPTSGVPADKDVNSPKVSTEDSGPKPDQTLSEEEEETQAEFKVYSEDEPWKKYVPPMRVRKDYSSGWAMTRDLLLCLPLSVFTQIIQINYQVDGLEEYLSDPEKQHYLVSRLPAKIKRPLLYKRRYIFSFHENLQKLAYMGLLQFGPVEKFKDKDQVFIYLKRHATIVDTTSCEPHYWLVSEPPDEPFERRHYLFTSAEDTENYWFDLMCVCLNTPLGVFRSKRTGSEEDTVPLFVRERNVFVGLAYLLKGSLEVEDEGLIPGDGKGAGGLDSEFFAHMKRNWLWTNHLLAVKKKKTGSEAKENQVRLKSLCRSVLRIVLQAEASAKPRYLTAKKKIIIEEDVQVVEEPATRNKQVMGGKQQKRKRVRKEVVKAPRKKKEPRKRTPAHDERDHEALRQMTRQRVYWSVQEDSLMMLCAVANHLLNSKLKRPFVPYCVVRDILHKEFKDKSCDKTSLAVGRRTRYILKNTQTLLNYRICLAEVGRDKALLKLLEQNKPKDPEKPEDCSESFSEFVRLLRVKFSSTMSSSHLTIPDSKQQLFSQFKICAIDNGRNSSYSDSLNSTEDIHSIVLHNLIQSTLAMTNSQMKSARSFQTFHVYSSFSQELLCQVFIQCRKRGLVNRRRVNQGGGPKKNRALPILPMSYQLSQSYYRCFSWRFPQVLCTDAFRFTRSLLNLPRGDHRALTDFYQEPENRTPDGELQEAKKDKSQKSKDTDADEEEVEEQTDPPDVSDMLQFSLESPGGACVAALTLMSLGRLSVFMSIPKQMVVVDSTLVDSEVVKSMTVLDDEDEDEEEGEEGKKMEVKAHQASHTKYLMMRGFCTPGIVKLRNLSTNDNIVVESCIMKVQLRDTPAHCIFTVHPDLDLSKCGPSLLPPTLSLSLSSPLSEEQCRARLVEERGYSPQDVQACALLWDSLERTGDRGLDTFKFCHLHKDLEEAQAGRTRTLQQYMQDLVEEGQVVEVGARGPRWVLRRHAEPWLITINSGHWNRPYSDSAEPFHQHKHEIPFMRKRRHSHRRERETEAKRAALNTCKTSGETEAKRAALNTCNESEETQAKQAALNTCKEETEAKQAGLNACKESEEREAKRAALNTCKESEEREAKQSALNTCNESEEIEAKRAALNTCNESEERETVVPAKRAALDTSKESEKTPEERGEDTDERIQEIKRETQEEQQKAVLEDQPKGAQDMELQTQEDQLKGSLGDGLEEEEQMKTHHEQEEEEQRRPVKRQRRSTQSCTNPCCAPATEGANEGAGVSFVPRPWRMVDGKLNRLVVKGMLEALLHHIMSAPGLTQDALFQHYRDVLQPLTVMELIQTLIELGCVKKKTLTRRSRQSLFSRPSPPPPPCPPPPLPPPLPHTGAGGHPEDPHTVYYEPTLCCVLRLGQVLPNERHWNSETS